LDTPPAVVEMVQNGTRIMRLENETQMQMAVQRPRNERAVLKGALMELEIAPEFAKRAFYAIPYKDRTGGEEKTVTVEGASMKLAMSLARRWGSSSNAWRVADEEAEAVVVEGVFLDYETNVRTLRTIRIAKKQWSKYSNAVVPLRADRLNMAIQAGGSKVVRNAILASLPVSIVDACFMRAKDIATGKYKIKGDTNTVPVTERIEKAKAQFVKMGATLDSVNKYIAGLSLEDDDAVLANLIGAYNAITDGAVAIADVFGAPANATPPKEGDTTVGDLLGGRA